MEKEQKPEKVFISYSHDNDEHVAKALDLANRLREDGVDAMLDQYEEAPEEGWPRWMDRQIHKTDFVLVIGSEIYFNRLIGDEEDGKGLGAKWEGAILYQHLYERDTKTVSYIPIVFDEDDSQFIPTPLRGLTRYIINSEEGYEKLYRRITNQPKIEKPRLGARKELPEFDVKRDSTMYVTGPIDVELWNKAEWQGTFFITGENAEDNFEPRIGLGFRNEEYARKIFEGWYERYGANDFDEEIRVSIIEGSVEGEDDGYTVHISADWDATFKRLSRKSKIEKQDIMVSISRLNRMVPRNGSVNLDRFKEAVRHSKIYHLMPGVLDASRTNVIPIRDLEIRKSKIQFRHVDDIGKDDPDIVVLKTGEVERPVIT